MFAELKEGFNPKIFYIEPFVNEYVLWDLYNHKKALRSSLNALAHSNGTQGNTLVFKDAEFSVKTPNAHIADISDTHITIPQDTHITSPLRSISLKTGSLYLIGAMNAPCIEDVIGCLEIRCDRTLEMDLGINDEVTEMPYLAVRKEGGRNTEIVRVASPSIDITEYSPAGTEHPSSYNL
ncbi:MAG: hypothetical protein KAJ24_05655 [Candidatus Aenigmarchaeota archaeon]|nr:hypothetical protein [Candidatus Aenigmarchaeota archaeon]